MLTEKTYHNPRIIATINDSALCPHPTGIGTRTLRELLALLDAGGIAPDRQLLAGVPSLSMIRAEVRRRESLGAREVVR